MSKWKEVLRKLENDPNGELIHIQSADPCYLLKVCGEHFPVYKNTFTTLKSRGLIKRTQRNTKLIWVANDKIEIGLPGNNPITLEAWSNYITRWRKGKEFYTPEGIDYEKIVEVTEADVKLYELMCFVICISEASEDVRKHRKKEFMERMKFLKFAVHDESNWEEIKEIPESAAAIGKLMLVVSELAEAGEAIRNQDWDNFKEELADTFIRLFDLCGAMNINIEEEISKKMRVNEGRPIKHGKKTML